MYVMPLLTPRLLCHLHCMILVTNSRDLSHDSVFVRWFLSWGERWWWWWWFFEVIPCRFAWAIWHISEWCSRFSGRLCSSSPGIPYPHVHNPFGNWRTLIRSLDDWWGERWRLVAQFHALGCLASGHKAWSELGWEGRRDALQLDLTSDHFSDNAHNTIWPRSVDTKTLL